MESMAPAKSQPLHDFNLPSLKWNKDGNSKGHPQRRRSVKSPVPRRDPSSLSPLRQSPLREFVSAPSHHLKSPLRDSVSPSLLQSPDNLRKQSPISAGLSGKQSPEREWVKGSPMGSDAVKKLPIHGDAVKQFPKRDFASESETLERNKGGFIEYRRNRSRNSACESVKYGVSASSSEQTVQKSEKRQKMTEVDAAGIKKSKFLIKIPRKNKSEEGIKLEVPRKIDTNDKGDEIAGVKGEMRTNNSKNEETKIRSLRPRKPVSKSLNANAAGARISTSVMSEKNKSKSPSGNEANRSMEIEKNGNGGGAGAGVGAGGEKKVKRKLSISIALSKAEIEEDIFSMTGSKPRRKPKKRAKNIQKQVDFVFPGMWLVSITPDSYKVSENYLKVFCRGREFISPIHENVITRGSCKSNTLFIKDDKEIESAKQSSKAAGEKGKQPKLDGKSGKQKKKKKKKKKKEEDFLELPNFSLELRREEITEDIYGMTGKMPSRTLKKRERNVQKQIENFPWW